MPLASGPSWFAVPLIELWFVALFLTLAMFLWLDGTNFGMGILYGLADEHEARERILAATAPFWDGAEVWLIVFGGALFAVFPDVYGRLFSGYYLLMFAILGSLILRGISPEFMEQREDPAWHRAWGLTFIIGSTLSPFFLGMFAANWLVGAERIITLPAIVCGLALVGISTAQGAGFLGMKSPRGLGADIARYARIGQVAYLLLAVVTVVYLFVAVDGMARKVMHPVVLGLVVLTAVLGVAYLVFIGRESYFEAFLAAGAQIFGLVALVAVLLFPVIHPASGLDVFEAAVSDLQLKMMTVVLAIFLPLVLGYFAVLYNAFSGPIDVAEGY
ncbi:MAG: cytochrome d ubiquinol oxidase subunit II [Halodesulfurarchaeum sp.]